MTYRHCFALAFVLAAVACGKGGGGGTPDAIGPQDPEYNDQAPPVSFPLPGNSYQQPPHNGTQQPAYNPEAPPGGGSPGGGGGTPPPGDCTTVCDGLIAAGCNDAGETREECVAGCAAFPQLFGMCADEFMVFLSCLVNDPEFRCVDGEIDEQYVSEACYGAAIAFSQCEDANEPEPPANQCTQAESCMCDNDCDTCECFFPDDPTFCADICAGGG